MHEIALRWDPNRSIRSCAESQPAITSVAEGNLGSEYLEKDEEYPKMVCSIRVASHRLGRFCEDLPPEKFVSTCEKIVYHRTLHV